MQILIIKLGALGDVLRTTSILKGLKEKYPDAKITWVTKANALDLLKDNKDLDNLYTSDNLKKQNFDLIINLDDEIEACKLATDLDKKELIGAYLENDKPTYTDSSSKWFDMGLISKFGKQKADELKKLNKKSYQQIIGEILDIKIDKPILNLSKENKNFAEKFAKKNNIKEGDLVIGLNTSAGKRWKLKSLSIEKTAELANKILNAKILLFGGPEETERNNKIKELAPKIIDAGCNNSLLDFAALVNLCNVLVASDSLAMNIGLALNKKTIVFFGPTSYEEIELYGNGKKILPKMECICCYKKECDKSPNCMDNIDTEEIFNTIKEAVK